VAVAVVAVLAAIAASAFTASSTVPAHDAGSGAAVVTGYTVSNPTYTFSADGATVTVAEFDLDKAASDVKAALTGTPVNADWQDCGAAVALHVTCTFATPVAVANHVALNVIAVSNGVATIAP
jgi:hypothetical protein